MNRFRLSQSWIALTLFALVMMAGAPGFAFTCHCATPTASPSCHHALGKQCSMAHHAHCHTGADDDKDDAHPLASHCHAAPTNSPNHTVRATHTNDCCGCQVSDAAPVTPSESPTFLPHSFSTLATLPAHASSFALPQQPTLCFTEHQAGPPPDPTRLALPSRAPPAI